MHQIEFQVIFLKYFNETLIKFIFIITIIIIIVIIITIHSHKKNPGEVTYLKIVISFLRIGIGFEEPYLTFLKNSAQCFDYIAINVFFNWSSIALLVNWTYKYGTHVKHEIDGFVLHGRCEIWT